MNHCRRLISHFTFTLALLAFAAAPAYADQSLAGNVTITGGTTGNLTVTGSVDNVGSTLSIGALTSPNTAYPGIMLMYANDSMPGGLADSLQFLVNRNPASWLWLNNTGTPTTTTYVKAMRLDSGHQLVLFQADGATAGITLTPASRQISLGAATLSNVSGVLTTSAPLSVGGGITNTNGTLTGGTTGLTLNSGGTNQNITLTPNGSGNIILIPPPSTGKVGIGTTSPASTLQVHRSTGAELAVTNNASGTAKLYVGYDSSGGGGTRQGLEIYRNYGDATIYFNPTQAGSNIAITANAGNVGLGTTAPQSKLDVRGSIISANTDYSNGSAGSFLQIQQGAASGNTYSTIGAFSAGGTAWNNLSLQSGGGNVGIGTTNPGTALDVRGVISTESSVNGAIVAQLGKSSTDSGFLNLFTGGLSTTFIATNQPSFFNGGNVGIGTASPGRVGSLLQVQTDQNASTRVLVANDNSGSSSAAEFVVNAYGNSWALGMGSTANNSNAFYIGMDVSGGTPSAKYLSITTGGNVGIGTPNPTQKLSVAGTVRAYAIVVDTGWSDYVFKPDYKLASLSEVEGSIQRDGHLPGIPSAADVAEHGVSLGDMQSKLLAKVEELTLHLIAQEKEIGALKAQNVNFQHQLSDLKGTTTSP